LETDTRGGGWWWWWYVVSGIESEDIVVQTVGRSEISGGYFGQVISFLDENNNQLHCLNMKERFQRKPFVESNTDDFKIEAPVQLGVFKQGLLPARTGTTALTTSSTSHPLTTHYTRQTPPLFPNPQPRVSRLAPPTSNPRMQTAQSVNMNIPPTVPTVPTVPREENASTLQDGNPTPIFDFDSFWMINLNAHSGITCPFGELQVEGESSLPPDHLQLEPGSAIDGGTPCFDTLKFPLLAPRPSFLDSSTTLAHSSTFYLLSSP
jgi:hypothetical protein